ncbi:D-glycerate dehydrogenase [Streptomyces sp. ISL-10]|uniref:2-hydroxyacid dehydrogenase n=1 Tax=Streptomyces sp. ISL-10 TaxID=2819172 RepID=UPI001BE78CE8|nr:NAD(P)-dependent oxidoreductase [Streptomyces sp. ISL-10]MBT2363970.1 D-glycerate dehydrogenase [Streptomyces sp. ISL-10]
MPAPDQRLLLTADLPGIPAVLPSGLTPARWPGGDRAGLLRAAAGSVALLVTANEPVDEPLLRAAGGALRVVGTYSTGVDHIDMEACERAGVRVVTAEGALASAVAEHAFGLLLSCARRIVEADRFVRSGAAWRWEADAFLGAQLAGRRLGVLGLGAIGGEVARRAQAFGMEVHGLLHRPGALPPGVTPHPALVDLMRVSDFLTIHVPLTPRTERMVDKSMLSEMPPGAVVVNTSRGRVMDQRGLIELLETGRLGGAALDVFEDEPFVPAELRRSPRTVLTPHIGSATTMARQSMTAAVLRRIGQALHE